MHRWNFPWTVTTDLLLFLLMMMTMTTMTRTTTTIMMMMILLHACLSHSFGVYVVLYPNYKHPKYPVFFFASRSVCSFSPSTKVTLALTSTGCWTWGRIRKDKMTWHLDGSWRTETMWQLSHGVMTSGQSQQWYGYWCPKDITFKYSETCLWDHLRNRNTMGIKGSYVSSYAYSVHRNGPETIQDSFSQSLGCP